MYTNNSSLRAQPQTYYAITAHAETRIPGPHRSAVLNDVRIVQLFRDQTH